MSNNNNIIINDEAEVNVALFNPFKPSATVKRTPPKTAAVATRKPSSSAINADDDAGYIGRLKIAEEQAFVKLGSKLSTMNSIVSEAKNIHKTIRDNLMQAVALYQQLRENREAIALSNVIGDSQKYSDIQTENKEVQTEIEVIPKAKQKRTASISPEKSKINKKVRTGEPERKETKEKESEISENKSESNSQWSMVERRKAKVKKKSERNSIRRKGDSITIQSGNSTYADIVKKMKTSIKPEEIGFGIQKIRKTKEGDVQIVVGNRDGNVKKLEDIIKSSLGEEVRIQTRVEKFFIDIRDMEETTDEEEIISSIVEAVNDTEARSNIQVRNIRNFYGGTKQALVEIPANIAATLLKNTKIRVGLVQCRIRQKIFAKHCYRCLEQGHIARNCQGKDRSKMCRKCGIDGHKSNSCPNQMRCVICLEAKQENTHHYMGTGSYCRYAI